MILLMAYKRASCVKVRIFNEIKAWHHNREESVPLNNFGDLDLREIENILGYVCKVSVASDIFDMKSSHLQLYEVFNPKNCRVVKYAATNVLKKCDLDFLIRDSGFLSLLKC